MQTWTKPNTKLTGGSAPIPPTNTNHPNNLKLGFDIHTFEYIVILLDKPSPWIILNANVAVQPAFWGPGYQNSQSPNLIHRTLDNLKNSHNIFQHNT